MRSLFFSIVPIFVVFAAVCLPTKAQPPTTAFTYQGVLNFNGSPANGSFDFEFGLFDFDGNQAAFPITRNGIAVSNGVYAVSLDFGFGPFPGPPRFLEVRVRPSGAGPFTTLTPRQLITPTPYSLLSRNSSQLGGIPAANFVQSGAAVINAGTQFNIDGNRVLSVGGTNNISLGIGSGSNGSDNSFFGSKAGLGNSTGTSNSFFGSAAGDSNGAGSNNTFIGASAGESNGSGNGNTFVGFKTGGSSTAFDNMTAVGAHAFVSQSNTVVLGSISGINGASSNTQVGIGTSDPISRLTVAGNSSLFGTNGAALLLLNKTVNMGFGQSVSDTGTLLLSATTQVDGANSGSAKMAIDPDGNVGIGTTTPARRLHVSSGPSGATSLSSSDFVIEDDASAFQHFLTPNDVESGILFGDPTDSIGGGIIFNNAATNNGIFFRSGGNVTRMTLTGAGNLGIGTTSPADMLDINGDIRVGSGTTGCVKDSDGTVLTGTCSSDLRFKRLIASFGSVLQNFTKLRPVHFYWRKEEFQEKHFGTRQSYGLIAQDVEKLFPELVTTDEQGYKLINYSKLPLITIQAVKEQQAQIESQQKEIETLKAAVKELHRSLCEANSQVAICKGEPK